MLAGHVSRRHLAALCRPTFGASHAGRPRRLALLFAMWCAMALAMMLPTAAPMILTYADLAETAAAKGRARRVAARAHRRLRRRVARRRGRAGGPASRCSRASSLLDATMASASPLFSGAVFVAAGALPVLRAEARLPDALPAPVPFFFANWTAEPRGVFRLGLRQGLYCLGCCWAMMLLMFAVGVMNVVWMAVARRRR